MIDSPAFVALTFSARSLLLEVARQLTKDNNGHLQATHSYMQRHGFSENTLSRAIADLIKHGMIYRTRSGGYQLEAKFVSYSKPGISNGQHQMQYLLPALEAARLALAGELARCPLPASKVWNI